MPRYPHFPFWIPVLLFPHSHKLCKNTSYLEAPSLKQIGKFPPQRIKGVRAQKLESLGKRWGSLYPDDELRNRNVQIISWDTSRTCFLGINDITLRDDTTMHRRTFS